MAIKSFLYGLLGGLVIGCVGSSSVNAADPVNPVTDGLKLWLKADTGVEVGAEGGVIEWQDQSGNENHASQTDESMAPKVAANALNNKPALRFDGDNDFLDVPASESLSLTADITTFFVVRFDDFATYRAVWAKTEVNYPAPVDYYLLPGTGVPRGFRGDGSTVNFGSVDGTTAIRANTYLVLGWESADKIFTHYFNGQESGSALINVEPGDTGQNLKIGTRTDLFTKMKGDIAELLIYDTALSDTDREAVFTYLKTKYNLLNLAPSVQITAPANNASVAAPGEFKLTANASDPDDRVTRVDFYANGSFIGRAFAPPYQLTVKVETPGPVQFTATAVDSRDTSATSTPVSVAITGSSTVPALEANESLKLWLKADAITGDAGTVVTQWSDSSGNANDAFADFEEMAPLLVSDADGINGHPAVRFDGTDDFLRVFDSDSLVLTGDLATYAVMKVDDFGTYRAVWSQTGGSGGNLPRPNDWYFLPGSGVSRFFRGTDENNINAFVDGGKATAGVPLLGSFEQIGTTASQYLNGSLAGQTQFNFTPADSSVDLLVGSRTDGVTRMKGDISELLIFDGALSDAQRLNLQRYLGTKYNIAVISVNNLPPVVEITSPASGGQYAAGDQVTLTATATDSDGAIQRVDFYANGALAGSSAGPVFSVPVKINGAGAIQFTAIAVDNLNAQTTSAAVAGTASGPALPIPAEGLALWLRADQGVVTGENNAVASWADFSGSFNNAVQADPSAAPSKAVNAMSSRDAIRFDGVNDYLSIPPSPSLSLTGDLTVLFVARMDDLAGYRTVIAKTAGNLPAPIDWYMPPDTGVPQLFRGGPGGNNNSQAFAPFTAGVITIAGFDVDTVNATANHYLNGENNGSMTLSAAAVDTLAPALIGTRGDLFTKMKGDIAEILVWNRLLDETERGNVMNYLNTRYGVGIIQVELSINSESANTVKLSWPTAAGPYELESSSDLANWTPVPNTVLLEGDMVTVTVNTTGTAQFFRLKQ
jgi:hypothetical protein